MPALCATQATVSRVVFRRVKKHGEITAQDQGWPLVVTRRQSPPDPFAHRVPMNAEAGGDLFHRVATVSFDEPVIRVAHGLAG